MTADTFRIGLAGLGTVGVGVIKILQTHADMIAARAGRKIEVLAISARDQNRDRGIDLSAYEWTENPERMAGDPRLDAVVEVMGGSDGPALSLVETALKARKPVVTANKALIATHGVRLAGLSDQTGTPLKFEAAVAGGIPVIKALRESFAGNRLNAVYGILNGTCNYILTEMRRTGRNFLDVLEEAQAKGYAEADPTFDIDGIDAAHKLSILTALGFGVKPDFPAMKIAGIRHVSAGDIDHAAELGYRIKLLGVARRLDDGKIVQSVEPCLVPEGHPLAAVDDVFNAVFVDGDFMGKEMLVGRGAGEGPTASAVVADLIDLVRGDRGPSFGVPVEDLVAATWAEPADITSGFYLHLTVLDKPGVLAAVSAILRDYNVSVEAMIQRGRNPDQPVSIVLTTHEARQSDIDGACADIAKLPQVTGSPCVMKLIEI